MTYSDTYYKIATLLEELPEHELEMALILVETQIAAVEHMKNYDPAKDPMLTGEGLFEGPADLSERVEEILYGEDTPAQKNERVS